MKLGSFTIDRCGNILSLDSVALKYANRKTGDILWFCEGKIKINDIIINICIDKMIDILIYKNKDFEMIPFSKSFCIDNAISDKDIVDIIYSEEHIKISLCQNQLRVRVNDQQCSFCINDTSEFLVICDDGGIEFFSNANMSHEFLARILAGEKYDAYISYEKLLHIQDVYSKTISKGEALSQIREEIHDFKDEEFEKLEFDGKVDWIYLNGEKRYLNSFCDTLLKVYPELWARTSTGDTSDYSLLDDLIMNLENGDKLSSYIHIKQTLNIKEHDEKNQLRVHMPMPQESQYIKNLKILDIYPEPKKCLL